jgi:hypothetical protein
MTPKRLVLTFALVLGLTGVAFVARDTESTGVKMTDAASRFLDSLAKEQKDRATYPFDSPERTNWWFVPHQKDKKPLRKGLPLSAMTAEQKDLARALLRAGTSKSGYDKATTIMSLESILHDLEKNGAMVRNPGWYFFTIFGTPSRTSKWGWRVEGHHLSLNFVVDRGKVAASTPAFFGANPANPKRVKKMDLKLKPILPEAEDLALDLFASFDEEQRKVARQEKQFPEIEQGKPIQHVGAPVGLEAAKMNDKQRGVLRQLIESYAHRMPAEVASGLLAEVKAAGLDRVHYAFARNDNKPGKPHTYRVQGKTFVIEFLNEQPDSAGDPANHIHSAWRCMQGDFGIKQ